MSRKFNFNIVTFSRDQIEEMAFEDLQQEISKIKRMIKEAAIQGRDTIRYEVEYCYLDHERQMRFGYESRLRKKSSGGYH
jgi:hypothetical protein